MKIKILMTFEAFMKILRQREPDLWNTSVHIATPGSENFFGLDQKHLCIVKKWPKTPLLPTGWKFPPKGCGNNKVPLEISLTLFDLTKKVHSTASFLAMLSLSNQWWSLTVWAKKRFESKFNLPFLSKSLFWTYTSKSIFNYQEIILMLLLGK